MKKYIIISLLIFTLSCKFKHPFTSTKEVNYDTTLVAIGDDTVTIIGGRIFDLSKVHGTKSGHVDHTTGITTITIDDSTRHYLKFRSNNIQWQQK